MRLTDYPDANGCEFAEAHPNVWMEVIMQSLAEQSLVRQTHGQQTPTLFTHHMPGAMPQTDWFHMLVVMSNTHIEGGEGAERRRRWRGESEGVGRRGA